MSDRGFGEMNILVAFFINLVISAIFVTLGGIIGLALVQKEPVYDPVPPPPASPPQV